MATEAQVVANRRNAQRSTGPRTAEGKETASQNAVKHGLSGCHDVIRGEDQGEFDQYREELFYELNPLGTMQCRLVERIVSLAWRLRRAERLQNEALETLLAKETSSALASRTRPLWGKPPEAGESGDGESAVGQTIVRDFANSRVLDRLSMYERRIESSLYRTMNELRKLQREQESQARVRSVPARASSKTREIAPLWHNGTVAANCAKQSQSPPGDGVRCTPYKGGTPPHSEDVTDFAKRSQSTPGDGVRCTPYKGGTPPHSEDVTDFAKQSQSTPVDGVHGRPWEGGDAGPSEGTPDGVTTNEGDPAKQSQSPVEVASCLGPVSLLR